MIPRSILAAACLLTACVPGMRSIRVSDDARGFVDDAGRPFTPWGFNYDHDRDGRLIEDYWEGEWATVVEDFGEMKALGANVVRIHLQVGRFMEAPDRPNRAALDRLGKLLRLAEETGLWLDLTGLGCYHKKDIPAWYDPLPEQERWAVQARFWEAVAERCASSPAVFCYDLMNEPILAGKKKETEWLGGELGGKFFVQRITLDLKGRTRGEVAAAWVDRLVKAIRKHDRRHLVTVGVIPWVFHFDGGKPIFYAPEVGGPLDFVSVHFYPKKGELDKALKGLAAYAVGKPVVIEETFPLKSGPEDFNRFLEGSAATASGWIGFYWGATPEELEGQQTFQAVFMLKYLERFRQGPPIRAASARY